MLVIEKHEVHSSSFQRSSKWNRLTGQFVLHTCQARHSRPALCHRQIWSTFRMLTRIRVTKVPYVFLFFLPLIPNHSMDFFGKFLFYYNMLIESDRFIKILMPSDLFCLNNFFRLLDASVINDACVGISSASPAVSSMPEWMKPNQWVSAFLESIRDLLCDLVLPSCDLETGLEASRWKIFDWLWGRCIKGFCLSVQNST